MNRSANNHEKNLLKDYGYIQPSYDLVDPPETYMPASCNGPFARQPLAYGDCITPAFFGGVKEGGAIQERGLN